MIMVTNNDVVPLLLCPKSNNVHQEKPRHLKYLNEFRTQQCLLFLDQQCQYHRPYTCFHWHFPNQKRRRPFKRADGTFNYNPDVYCDKYDETSGSCIDGDNCPYAHRNAGDTERRYHPRYFKTGNCIYETTDSGACVKNGLHCAFAHGPGDIRPPVYDIREVQDASSKFTVNLPASLEKERVLSEDPKWNEMFHVLACYKTDVCRKPPRMCRQGYSCPFYHNGKDKRRAPDQWRYRSTPCPSVRPGDEWQDSGLCEASDQCVYCHTRTEQQFHPEIYKSTKCNDVINSGYCPRGPFCAFAHCDSELSTGREFLTKLHQEHQLAAQESVLFSTGPTDSGRALQGSGMPLSLHNTANTPASFFQRTSSSVLSLDGKPSPVGCLNELGKRNGQLPPPLFPNLMSPMGSIQNSTPPNSIINAGSSCGDRALAAAGRQRAGRVASPHQQQQLVGIWQQQQQHCSTANMPGTASNVNPAAQVTFMNNRLIACAPDLMGLSGGSNSNGSGNKTAFTNNPLHRTQQGPPPVYRDHGRHRSGGSSSLDGSGCLSGLITRDLTPPTCLVTGSDGCNNTSTYPGSRRAIPIAATSSVHSFQQQRMPHMPGFGPHQQSCRTTGGPAFRSTPKKPSTLSVAPNFGTGATQLFLNDGSRSSTPLTSPQCGGGGQSQLGELDGLCGLSRGDIWSPILSTSGGGMETHLSTEQLFNQPWTAATNWPLPPDSGHPSESQFETEGYHDRGSINRGLFDHTGTSTYPSHAVGSRDSGLVLDPYMDLTTNPHSVSGVGGLLMDATDLLDYRTRQQQMSLPSYTNTMPPMSSATEAHLSGRNILQHNSTAAQPSLVTRTDSPTTTTIDGEGLARIPPDLFEEVQSYYQRFMSTRACLPGDPWYRPQDHNTGFQSPLEDVLLLQSQLSGVDGQDLTSSSSGYDRSGQWLNNHNNTASPVLSAMPPLCSDPMAIPGRSLTDEVYSSAPIAGGGGGGAAQTTVTMTSSAGRPILAQVPPGNSGTVEGTHDSGKLSASPWSPPISNFIDIQSGGGANAPIGTGRFGCLTNMSSPAAASQMSQSFSPIVGTPIVRTSQMYDLDTAGTLMSVAQGSLSEASIGSNPKAAQSEEEQQTKLTNHSSVSPSQLVNAKDVQLLSAVVAVAAQNARADTSAEVTFPNLAQSPILASSPFSNPRSDLERLTLQRQLNDIRQRLDSKEGEVVELKKQRDFVTEHLLDSLDVIRQLFNSLSVSTDLSKPLYVDTDASVGEQSGQSTGYSAITGFTTSDQSSPPEDELDPELAEAAAAAVAGSGSSETAGTNMRIQQEQQEALAALLANPIVTALLNSGALPFDTSCISGNLSSVRSLPSPESVGQSVTLSAMPESETTAVTTSLPDSHHTNSPGLK